MDIAFLPSVATDPIECFRIAGLLTEQFGKQVDLIDLTN